MTLRIDAHQHFWVYNEADYGWMDERMGRLRRDFLPGDLAREQAALAFDGSVAVQARSTLEETAWLLELADADERIRGVVGWVELCSPEVSEQLDLFAAHPKCVGMRHLVHDEPDVEFMLQPEFLHGLEKLDSYGLVYDLLLRPPHLPIARRVVERFPNQRFVLDHMAKPAIAEQRFSPWDEDLRRLARCENVSCKLSGLVTEAEWNGWKPRDFAPYLEIVLDAFGSERCMVGSDWPVCTLAGEYSEVMKLVIDWISQLSASEQAAILGETCSRVYGLV